MSRRNKNRNRNLKSHRNRVATQQRLRGAGRRGLFLEPLEDRRMLAVFSEVELNDTQAMANVVTVPTGDILTTATDDWLTIKGTISSSSDVDFFSFTLGAPSGVFFDIDSQEVGLGNTLDSFLTLVNAGGGTVATNDDGYDFEGFNAPAASTGDGTSLDSSLYADLGAGTFSIGVSESVFGAGDYYLRILADTNYSATVPVLNSNPGATDTFYLDFDGHASNSDTWVTNNGNTPYNAVPFDLNGNGAVFSPGERLAIRNILEMASEDYSPYNINVTTVNPGAFPNGVAFRQVVTNSSPVIVGSNPGILGVSFVGSYVGGAVNTAWTWAANFNQSFGGGVSGAIMATALEQGNTSVHEIGHALTLRHFSTGGGPATVIPNGIMATPDQGFNREVWSNGTNMLPDAMGNPDAVVGNPQNDIEIIGNVATNQIGFRPDDHGNTTGTATVMPFDPTTRRHTSAGIIERLVVPDSDFFRFDVFDEGLHQIRADVDEYRNDLNTELRVYDSGGGLIAASDPAASFDAQLDLVLAPGMYFAEVRSNAQMGEIGQYIITVDQQDRFEENDSLQDATILGSNPAIREIDLTIHDDQDVDFFKITANSTGKLIINTFFTHADGDLDIQVQDMNGNVIASSLSGTDNEQVIIPVVGQEMYFLRVFGANGSTNTYDLEIENFAAPAPAFVDLTASSDTGMMEDDNITADTTPTFLIQADLVDFRDMGIDLLNAATIDPNGNGDASDATDDGAGVYVSLINLATGIVVDGFANQLGPSGFLWTFTLPALDALDDGDYFVSAAVQIVDGQQDPNRENGRAQLSDPLFISIIGDPGDDIDDLVNADLLVSSDTGMLDIDNVTNKMQPAFQGIAPVGYKVRLYANGELVGQTVAGSDTSDVGIGGVNGLGGDSNDGLGLWEITTEPLADNGYDITLEVEDPAGNVTLVDPDFNDNTAIDVWVDTAVPNTPLLDLLEASDSGRHDADNITNDNTPTFVLIGDDTVGGNGNPFPNDVKYRLYDRPGNGTGEVLIYDSFAALSGFTTLGQITFTSGVLADGVHNLKLEVEDRAGNVSPDFLLEIIVDTLAPPVSFGLPGGVDGLAAESDSGVNTMPATYADRVTNDTTPALWGQAEADSVVRVYADVNGNGAVDAGEKLIGETVAVPWDGNQAFADGYWEITSVIDLNDPAYFPLDGLRELLVTAEDPAGNLNDPDDDIGDQQLEIFIDTQGPRVDAVHPTYSPDYDLFDPKPSENGPTPLIDSLSIVISDLPDRVAPDFLYEILKDDIASVTGNYLLVGDHVGIIPIDSIVVNPLVDPDGASQLVIEIGFLEFLPDDRYTFTISDNLVDPAGNNLDGESNADEPLDDPTFPSGDGVPGGDFIARFTVDSRPEIGTYVAQNIDLDTNGNFVWDPATGEIGDDATNVDLSFTLPVADPDGSIGLGGYNVHDLLFAGKFETLGGLIVGDDAVFVIDVSGSTSDPFGGDPVGDQNNDGLSDTILDAEIAAFKVLNQQLVDRGLGDVSSVAIVAFDSIGFNLDMDPVGPGLQLSTTPLADNNSNGIRDVDEALMSLNDGGLTNFEDALAKSIDTINAGAVAAADANVIFLSDGVPTAGGTFTDEVNTLRNVLNVPNLRAFGVGPGASLDQLLLIDPDAQTFSNTNELLEAFGGGNVPGGSRERFDQLAAYGYSAQLGDFRWIIDTNSDGVVHLGEGDILSIQPLQAGFDVAGAIPLAGSFDRRIEPDGGAAGGVPGDGNGDEIVLYNLGTWIMDTDRDFVIETNGDDMIVNGNLFGHPIIGDFDGDGFDDLAVFNNNVWYFDLADDGFGSADFDGDHDQTLVWGFPGVLDRPVAADMDQDGIDDIGLWVPRYSATPPRDLSEWYFLLSNDFAEINGGLQRVTGTIVTLDHPFEPVPFGDDLYAEFGDDLALPIVGNFDPPVDSTSESEPTDPLIVLEGDFDLDGVVDGDDFLAWQAGFGAQLPTVEVGLADGDADLDGDVDGDDFLAWQTTFNNDAGGGASYRAGSSRAQLVDPLFDQREEFGKPVLEQTLRRTDPKKGRSRDTAPEPLLELLAKDNATKLNRRVAERRFNKEVSSSNKLETDEAFAEFSTTKLRPARGRFGRLPSRSR